MLRSLALRSKAFPWTAAPLPIIGLGRPHDGPGVSCRRCWAVRGRNSNAMDRVLIGDNQFFGVNHMSEERARAQAMRFQDNKAVMDLLDCAYDDGVKTFMCTTHERIADICDTVRSNPARYSDFVF